MRLKIGKNNRTIKETVTLDVGIHTIALTAPGDPATEGFLVGSPPEMAWPYPRSLTFQVHGPPGLTLRGVWVGGHEVAVFRTDPLTLDRAGQLRWAFLLDWISGSKLPSGQTIEVEVELEEPGDVTVQVCGWIVDRGLKRKEDR